MGRWAPTRRRLLFPGEARHTPTQAVLFQRVFAASAPESRCVRKSPVAGLFIHPGRTGIITLEIDAEIPNAASDHVIRTVTENCRTLNLSDYGLEEE